MKISFRIKPEEAGNELLKLLNKLKELSILGASRCIGIKDAVGKEEQDFYIFFDGDGDHNLYDITYQISLEDHIDHLKIKIEEADTE